KTPPQVNTNIPDGNVPVGGTDPPDPDPNTNIDEDGIPGAGLDYIPEPPQNIPKTSDDANPRLWLIVLALSTIILRYELFLRKKGKKSKETKEGVD
ncbi:MAG: hypothetical protein FWG43_01480, partial [Clostridiales bacterium]|nr:hypothetical protein [Clostridiales bacterium]